MTAAVLTPPGRPLGAPPGTTIALRYRPLGDVLVAEVHTPDGELPRGDVVVDTVDADLTITWLVGPDGSRRLATVELVHASSVHIDLLPHGLDVVLGSAVADLVHRGRRAASAADSLAARARVMCRADIDLDGPVPCLDPPSARPSPLPGRTRLRRAVLSLADAVRSASALTNTVDPASAASLVSALEELADALGRHGGVVAPRSAAVARSRVVGAVGLSTAERIELRSLLDALGDTSAWPSLTERLARLADTIAPWQVRRPPLPTS
jgi:hypothetical protein